MKTTTLFTLGLAMASGIPSLAQSSYNSSQPAPNSTHPDLVKFKYELLSLGELKPDGWIRDQLELEANGLAGHLYDFYRYVKDSTWLGGQSEYSELHESAPYWYNGLVPLAYTLDDERLKGQVNDFLDYVLAHQAEDGWLGPEKTPETRGIWARMLLLQGMANHAIADPSREDEIVTSMHRYVKLSHSMLQNNFTGFLPHEGDMFDPFKFGVARAHEYSLSLQWLYEYHPRNQSSILWETMELMWQAAATAGTDWTTYFTAEKFNKGVSAVKGPPKIEHGVTMAEGLRYMAQMFRMTKNQDLVDQTRLAVDMVYQYQVGPAGSIIADEYLGALSPQRGSELCMSVEGMYSTAYLYRLLGDNDYADKTERAAFNSLPAGLSPDWWSHQYVTQTNQPWSRNLSAPAYYNVVPYGNTFGLEPNFPCCTVNHPAAYPKFFSSAVVRSGDDALLHAFLIPFSLETKVNGGDVSIESRTTYPFGRTVDYTIKASTSFRFGMRIPQGVTDASKITIGGVQQPFTPTADGIYWADLKEGQTDITIDLSYKLEVVPQINGAVSVYYGPVLYSLDIEYTETAHPALNWTDRKPLPTEETHPSVHDHVLLPLDDSWKVAIDPDQIRVESDPADPTLPSPLFTRGQMPASLSVAAINIEWANSNDTAGLPPTTIETVGEPFRAKLIPYGSAKLHIAELVVKKLDKVD